MNLSFNQFSPVALPGRLCRHLSQKGEKMRLCCTHFDVALVSLIVRRRQGEALFGARWGKKNIYIYFLFIGVSSCTFRLFIKLKKY